MNNNRKTGRRIVAILLMAVMILSIAGCKRSENTEASSAGGTVATDGSTSMEHVIGALGESFEQSNENVSFTYNPTGSGSGITAVLEKRCDIGLSSRALKDEEKAMGLTETTLALDGIAVIVNTANHIADLSVEQIGALYRGEITNWAQLGGNDAEIVCIGRESGSGTRDGFESITGTEDECVLRQELTSTGDVITAVAGNPNAIGYVSVSAIGDNVKALTVGGVAPTGDNIRTGAYAIQRPFNLITRANEALSPTAQAFFNYATSSEVNSIITKAGAVAIK